MPSVKELSRPLVIQTEQLDSAAGDWLRERCELIHCPWDDRDRLSALLPKAQGLLIRTYTRVDTALLALAPKLKVVARAGVGLDNVDLGACTARNVRVVSTPGANTRAVVELVSSFILDTLRPRVFLDAPLSKPMWSQIRAQLIAPKQLSDLTLGIIGFGRVGSAICRVGKAFDMRVVYHDLIEIPPERRFGGEPMSMSAVLAHADVLTLHPDGRRSNRHLINAKSLALLKPEVVLINTSRGFVVDPAALAEFLNAHPGAQAILDVHEPEPIEASNPLIGVANAHLTPHIGAATRTAHANMSWVVKDLWRVLNGEEPEHPAMPEPE